MMMTNSYNLNKHHANCAPSKPKPKPNHPKPKPKPHQPPQQQPTPKPPVNNYPPTTPTPTPKPPVTPPYTPPTTPPSTGTPVECPPTANEPCYLNLEGKGPSGFLGDALTGVTTNTGANEQWKNYTIGALGEAPKTFAPTHSDLVQCEDGFTPTLEGGLAGDPTRYLVHPTAEGAHFMPPSGTNLRVYQDEGITIDNRYEDINAGDGAENVAATQSMATIVDPANGQKHQIFLDNGQTYYIKPDGSRQLIAPDAKEPVIIGDPKDPLAKLEMKPGNPGNVPITLTHYERYSPETVKMLQDKGIDPSAAMKVRVENEIRWGNRLADGAGATERASAGTTDAVEVNQYYKGSEGVALPSPAPHPTTPAPKPPTTGGGYETPKAEGTPKPTTPAPAPEKGPYTPTKPGQGHNAIQNTATQTLSQNPMYKTLFSLLQKAGLESELNTLENKGDVSIFAPTEQAFSSLPAGVLAALAKPENRETLVKLLQYHISQPGQPTPSGKAPRVFDSLLEGDQAVYVGQGSKGNVINGSQIATAEVPRKAKNGSSITPVNSVLIPPGVDLSKLK
jgi:uncharacterized surface protein with fasciclin (FAS1) repeats